MTVKNVENLEKSRVAVTVEVGAEEFEAAVAKAYAKAGKLSIPGFRPGKAPRKMIESSTARAFSTAMPLTSPCPRQDAGHRPERSRCRRLSPDRDRGRQDRQERRHLQVHRGRVSRGQARRVQGSDGREGRDQGHGRRCQRPSQGDGRAQHPSGVRRPRPRRATPPSSTSRASTTA